MLSPGTVLQNRFEIVREIGRGGMGAVFEGRDLKFNGSPIAIKQCLLTSDQMKQAFFKEASLLARLDHPYLPDAREHFVEGEGHFLIMKYIEGDDLENLLLKRGHPFEVEEVKGWMDQVLDALVYMHGLTPLVIHRDIKPGNIKLTPTGHVKLIDFGLAKGGGGTSIAGYSLNYSAPEQLQETGSDARTDLYSLGATMYRLLSGQIPKSAFERTNSLLNDQPDPLVPLHRLNPRVPEAVSQVVAQALALKKNDRFAEAAEMKRALRVAAENRLPVVVPAYTPTQLPDAGFSRTVTPDKVSEPAPYSATEIKGEATGKPAEFSITQTPEEPAKPPAVSRTVARAEEIAPAMQTISTPTVQPDRSPLPVKEQASKGAAMGKVIAAATGSVVLIGGLVFWSLKPSPQPIVINNQSTASPAASPSASNPVAEGSGHGTILGSVTDQSGAVISGVQIVFTNINTNLKSTAVTNPTGAFIMPALIVGSYKMTVTQDGFKKYSRSGIVLEADQKAQLNVVLETGAVAERKSQDRQPVTPKPKLKQDASQDLINQMNKTQEVIDTMKPKKKN